MINLRIRLVIHPCRGLESKKISDLVLLNLCQKEGDVAIETGLFRLHLLVSLSVSVLNPSITRSSASSCYQSHAYMK